ncbi:MAG: hypothetical protein ACFFG0_53185 [Candidatus Thorarchaeota archaeon]
MVSFKSKKKKSIEEKVDKKTSSKGKTKIILEMIREGKERKEIIDMLVSIDPQVSRKSNSSLISQVIKRYDYTKSIRENAEISEL